jgi:tetratricopeptide (TPR) repeat protein
LTREDKKTLQKRYTGNSEAYQLYLQGRFSWKKRSQEGLNTAVRYFERAIEKDPDYALAWAGIADSYSLLGEYANYSRRETQAKIMTAVNKALAIDNTIAEAHISLAASLMMNDWNWKQAEKEFKLGIKLDPNYATGHHWYSEWLLYTGHTAEAFREITKAVQLDPVSHGILKDKGMYYYYTSQFDKAIETGKMALELEPNFTIAHRLLSLAFTAKAQYDEAIKENERWQKGTGIELKAELALAHIYAASGLKEKARAIIEEPGLEKLLKNNDYRSVAIVYATLGDIENAFTWLQKSYDMHEESLCNMKVDPKFEILHDDPRFKAFIKKMNFPE